MQARTIPLLAVRRVLLPGATLVVHAFEEGHRAMVDELDEGRLGIVLASDDPSHPRTVGTQAIVMHRQDLPDGRLRLLVSGERRFEVVEFLSSEPYPIALVEYLSDGPSTGEAIDRLVSEVEGALVRYVELAAEGGEGTEELPMLDGDPVAVSYQVASLMRISNPERQELLELPTAEARLDRELSVLRREIELLERVLAMGRPG